MKPTLKSRQVKICSLQNGLKQRNTLALLHKFVRKPCENQEQLKLNGFWSLLMLIYCTRTYKALKKKAIREFGLEVKTEKTKCMLMSHHQNPG
jgi:hypothetical protein